MAKYPILPLLAFGLMGLIGSPAIGLAETSVALCGNTCFEDKDGGPLCHWAPAVQGQTCKAKALCSGNECTMWWTAQAPTVDALKITQAQAKRLPGARTVKGSRPPSR